MKISEASHIPLTDFPVVADAERFERADAFRAAMATRRSVRQFSDRAVPRDVIEAAVRTAGGAPSGANHQPWFFACVASGEKKRAIRLAAEEEERAFYAGKAGEGWLQDLAPIGTDAEKPYLETAPWLICIFAQRKGGVNEGDARKNYYIHESVGIATGLMIAALHVAGVASLVHTPNPMLFLNTLCGRPETEKPYLILVAGYPAEDAVVPKHALIKKPLSAISSFL